METPSGLAYRLRGAGQQVSQSMCWEVSGNSRKENVKPSAYFNPIDVEYRWAQHPCVFKELSNKGKGVLDEVEWLLIAKGFWRCRLQAVEDTQGGMAEDLENLKGLGSQLSQWRNQMEEASSQVATVLNLVETDASDVRCHPPL